MTSPSRARHFYEPVNGHRLAHDPFNAIIAPRPIGWISTHDTTGNLNLAPYSFFNAFNYTPPLIGFSSTSYKDTVRNAEATGEFCWNLVTAGVAEQMNATSATVGVDVDEFALAGLTPHASRVVSVPYVAEALVSFECRVSEIHQLKSASGAPTGAWLTLGEVVGVHIDKSLIVDGVYQTIAAHPLLRAGGPTSYYGISEEHRTDMRRP